MFSTMRHSDAPTIRVFARPAQLKVLIDYANGAEARLVDGAKGWRNEAGGPLEPVTGPMYAAMVLQAARAGVPWVLYEHAAEATFTDSLAQADVRCVGIDCRSAKGSCCARGSIPRRTTSCAARGCSSTAACARTSRRCTRTSARWTA